MNPRDYGFLDFGVVEASPVDPTYFNDYLERGFCAGMDYLRRNFDKRMDPSQLVKGARSILCFLAPYGEPENGVAGFACGVDYHKTVKDRLFIVMKELSEEFPDFAGRAFVDSAPVLERYWAAKAGLGFIGNNGFLISPEWGLRTIIGVIVCNLPCGTFPGHDALPVNSCGDCGRCRRACPSGALCAGGLVDARKCISYNTIESKELSGVHPVDYKGWVFGCEQCLKVCPWNKPVAGWPEFETKRSLLRNIDWKTVTPAEFESQFADSGLLRAGLDKIRNNRYGDQV